MVLVLRCQSGISDRSAVPVKLAAGSIRLMVTTVTKPVDDGIHPGLDLRIFVVSIHRTAVDHVDISGQSSIMI